MLFLSAALLSLTALSAAVLGRTVPCSGPETVVNLRIEGSTGTLFDNSILTCGHDVTTPSGGTHHCDGTNHHAHPTPGPTCTSALDSASRLFSFEWDGTYFESIDDFFISSIFNETPTYPPYFWGIILNYNFTQEGGCQVQVQENDSVLFAIATSDQEPVLKLEGPAIVIIRQKLVLRVTDGVTGKPFKDAYVGGRWTDGNGVVMFIFNTPGTREFKAEAPGAVRSNTQRVLVIVGPEEEEEIVLGYREEL